MLINRKFKKIVDDELLNNKINNKRNKVINLIF